MPTLRLTNARTSVRELATLINSIPINRDVLSGPRSLSGEGIRHVTQALNAADTLLETLTAESLGDADDVDELVAFTQALRRLAFLVLAEHNPGQAWFWTPEWQAGERQANREIRQGRGHVSYSDEEFLAALDADIAVASDADV